MERTKKPDTKLSVRYVKISELVGTEVNPRKWDDETIRQVGESMDRYGCVDPIILNGAEGRFNRIIGGHLRVHAARKLGLEELPAVYVDIPDPERERELLLRLNRNVGSWDFELLKEFNLNLLLNVGFDDSDLSPIWDQLEAEDDGFHAEKAANEIAAPAVKSGELYRLGRHRLLCGDSTDPDSVRRLMGGAKARMAYCDPPYNIKLDYSKGISTSGKYGGNETDGRTAAEYRDFLKGSIENALAVCEPDAHYFYWCDQAYIGMVQSLYEELGVTNRRVCLWVKNNLNMVPHVAFNKLYEPCVYGTRGKPYLSENIHNLTEILNKEVDTGNRAIDDILDILDVWLVKRLAGQDYSHPTEKPVTLHEKPLRRCTKPGDVVLDLFAGSGSTLIACEQMRRTCYTCEQDPVFCQVVLNRFEELTGIKPELVSGKEEK